MLATLTLPQLAWIGASGLAAYGVRGMSRVCAGLVAAPMMAFVLPVHMVIPTTGLLVFILFIVITIRDRHEVDWIELKRLAIPTVTGVVASLFVFRMLDNRLLVLMLGGFLV